MRYRFVLLIIGMLAASTLTPVSAQSSLPPITPDNAAQLTQVGLLGQGYFRQFEWSPDSSTLAVASSVGVWFYTADQPEPRLIDQYGEVLALTYHPTQALMALAQRDQTLFLDTTTWEPVRYLAGGAYQVAFSPDGQFLALEKTEQVELWDMETNEVVYTWPHDGSLNCLTFDPRGRFVAGGTGMPKHSPYIFVWDTWTGDLVMQQRVDMYAEHIAFAPYQPHLAVSGSWFGGVEIWDFKKQQRVIGLGSDVGAWDLVYSTEGDALFVAATGEFQVWDTTTYQKTSLIAAPELTASGGGQAISPDKRILANASDNTVTWWDIDSGDVRGSFPGVSVGDSELRFSPDGTLLASADLNGPLNVWNIGTGMIQQSWEDGVYALEFSPDNKMLVGTTIDIDREIPINLWVIGIDQGMSLLKDTEVQPGCITFNPTGTQLALIAHPVFRTEWGISSMRDGNILILDSTSHAILEEIELPDNYVPMWIHQFSDEGLTVLLRQSIMSTTQYALYHAATGEIVSLPINEQLRQFSPDNRLVATLDQDTQLAGQDAPLVIWDTQTGEAILSLPTDEYPLFEFDPTSTLLAIVEWDWRESTGNLDIWDLTTGNRVFRYPLNARTADLEFNSDGTLLATAGDDNVIRLWGIAP